MAPSEVRVIFRDKHGRFVPARDRYTDRVAKVQVVRRREYLTVAERPLKPEELVNVLNQREFESLPEALAEFAVFRSRSKYKAWDIAEQVDRTSRVRRKNLKYTMVLQDGNRKRRVSFYHNIRRNSASSYSLFRRMNQEIGLEGMHLYDRIGGKIVADRKGRQVKLLEVIVEEVK